MWCTHELDSQQESQVIEHAGRDRAQVLVELCGATDSLSGQIVAVDESSLLVELSRANLDGRSLAGRYVDVQVFATHRYYFTTTIMTAAPASPPRTLSLCRPDRIQQLQRRRHLRARLMSTTTVRLRLSADRRSRVIEAALLNVSSDGFACRLSSASAAPLRVGQELGATFNLPDSGTHYSIPAEVRNRTAGADGTDFIGLQFVPAPNDAVAQSAINALRTAIYQQQTIANPQEVPA